MMHDGRKMKRVFHVNMLRAFQIHRASESNYFTDSVVEERDEDVLFWKDGDPDDQPTISERLSTEQQEQLRELLTEFDQVFQNQPGQTQLAEHRIETESVRQLVLSDYLPTVCHKHTVQMSSRRCPKDYWAILQWVAHPYRVGQKERRQPEAMCGLPETEQYLGNRLLSDTKNRQPDLSARKSHIHHYSRPQSRLLAGACSQRWPPQDCIYYLIWVVSVHEDAIWATGCPHNLSANVMDCLIQGCRDLPPLDDFVIYSDSWENHLEHLQQVLQRIKEAGFTTKPKKVPVCDGTVQLFRTYCWK